MNGLFGGKVVVTVEEAAGWLNRIVEAGHGKTPLVISEAGGVSGFYTNVADLLFDADEPVTAHAVDDMGIAEEAKTPVAVFETRTDVGWSCQPGQI